MSAQTSSKKTQEIIEGKVEKQKTMININQKNIEKEQMEKQITEINQKTIQTLVEILMLKRIVPKTMEEIIIVAGIEETWAATLTKDHPLIHIHQRKAKNLPVGMKTVIRKISPSLIIVHRIRVRLKTVHLL